MKNKPILSIVMVVYNEEKNIEQTLESLLSQTFSDFSLLITNNGSTDFTQSICKRYAIRDNRIVLENMDKNNPEITLDLIKKIKTKYYMFAAGHDLYFPKYIEKCIEILESDNSVVLAYSKPKWIDRENNSENIIPSNIDTRGIDQFSRMMITCYGLVYAHQFYGIYKTSALQKIKEHKVVGSDHVLLTELSKYGTFAQIDETLFLMRKTTNWDNLDSYRKKHHPNETDGIIPFVKMMKEYMNLVSDNPNDIRSKLMKISFAIACMLRYEHVLHMFGESLNTLLTHPKLLKFYHMTNEIVNVLQNYSNNPPENNKNFNFLHENIESNTTSSKGIIANSPSNRDFTAIQNGSEFEVVLKKCIKLHKPKKILETGTYLGTGTTRVIASTLKDLKVTDASFFTIECNPNNHNQAIENLKKDDLLEYVQPILGLSIPRNILPKKEDIYKSTVTDIPSEDIFVDHNPEQRTELYYKETDFNDVQDNLIDYCFEKFKGKPDFIVLDSGGHIGFIEFKHIISNIKSECIICLDDINHIKHFNSFKYIQSDKRFKVLHISKEKFGFCFVKFVPYLTDGQKILWVRTDAIGDCVLSIEMIEKIKKAYNVDMDVLCQENISTLYKNNKNIKNTIGINTNKFLTVDNYRNKILSKLHENNYDITINSTYSRDMVSDYISIYSKAKKIIAQNGDLSNICQADRQKNSSNYTHIVIPKQAKREIARNNNFINALGIQSEAIRPTIFLSKSDELFANIFFEKNAIDPDKTIIIFAGVQNNSRIYHQYGEALSSICKKNNFTVIALGSDKDFEINQNNLNDIKSKTINLCGKLSIHESAAIIKKSYFAIGAETGLAHIACAVGTRNIILLGGGHFGRFMPYTNLTSVICLPLECYNCNWTCKYDSFHCISGINKDMISYSFNSEITRDIQKTRIYIQSHLLWKNLENTPKWKIFNKHLDFNNCEIIPVTKNLMEAQIKN